MKTQKGNKLTKAQAKDEKEKIGIQQTGKQESIPHSQVDRQTGRYVSS